jgi:aminoglycoside N3'-acetyltransferase
MTFSVDHLTTQLRTLGVEPGGVLLVHTSYRAVRPVAGGPEGLIDALVAAVGDDGALVMPSWTENDDDVFDATSTAAASTLGVTPDLFWRRPNVRRSDHPFALAAFGPRAAEITSDPLPIPPSRPESPVGRVFDFDGQILLLGVGHDANTTIHLAELLAGVPYGVPKHCTVCEGSQAVRIDYLENDHCCALFTLADDWLRERALQREGPVGNAWARLARSRDVVGVVCEHLREEPLVFLHTVGSGCAECAEARASVGRRAPGRLLGQE